MTDYTKIVETIIALLVAIITTFVVPYIKSKIDDAKMAKIIEWVTHAVKAAEQIYKESGMGAIKNKYVKKFLEDHGVDLDIEQIDVLIESAVWEIGKKVSENEVSDAK